ncbi:hypothetical protein [[Lactobacillus] timonensis]|uniref:hypothetical protein n=1 Tax=[Lactobacillus] timonensis TaxID=1970790 RepID=UPI000C8417BD|nr:hypothetical protein [[Lactobacillus] timonensis]
MATQKKKDDRPKYDFAAGDVVESPKLGPLDHGFSGTVEKVYNNSMLVSIDKFDPADQSGVNELNGRAIVRMSGAKALSKVPRQPKEDEDGDGEEEAKKSSSREKPAKKSNAKKSSAKKSTKKTDK